MTTPALWLAGARPRTLPAAVSPVLAGTGLAWFVQGFAAIPAVLALVVSLALQVGVNYANDYSDGIRGTDADRVGPVRLVGSGAATPSAVRRAAFAAFGVAALAGLVIVVITQLWWLLAVGAASVLAAWFYTGGRRPYGYLGLGELFVFVFFGLVAVAGTVLVQARTLPVATIPVVITIGLLASAILVANNLRDIVGDRAAGKLTLATRLGADRTRRLFVIMTAVAGVGVVVTALLTSPWALLGLVMIIPAVATCRTVLAGAVGPALIAVLKRSGQTELLCAAGLLVGLLIGG